MAWTTRTNVRRAGLPLALALLVSLCVGAPGVATASVAEPPTLASPAAGDTLTDAVLRWLPLPGVKEYELQVSPNGDWANNLSYVVTVKGVQHARPVTLDNASYFWRVRASAGTVKGPWSEERLFHRVWTPVPELLAPADADIAVQIPTFRWSSISGASRYELQVGTDINFSPTTYDVCITTNTGYTPYKGVLPSHRLCDVDPAIGVTYFWRVRGLDDPGNVLGQWSSTRSFLHRKPMPTPLSPADGSSVSAPVLSWEPVGDSEQYVVTIHKRDGAVADTRETWATSYSPLRALKPADGPFSWFVRTKEHNRALGLAPERSAWWTFDVVAPTGAGAVPTPIAVTPSSGSTRSPSLTWAPVTGAVTYTVNYMTSGVYTPLQTAVPHAALTDPDKPISIGDFSWFVEAFGTGGAFLGRGPESTFRISSNPLVSYSAPCAVGEVCLNQVATPMLRWQPARLAGYYRVYLALDREFTNIVAEYVTQYTELTPRESLLDNQAGQSYYWFARACNGILCGPFGTTEFPTAATFRKQTAPVTGLRVVVEPASTSLMWDDYLTTRQYRVQVSASPDFAPLIDDILVDQKTYAPFAKTYPGGVPLYARVSATDGSSNLLTPSAPFTFQLAASAPTVTLSPAIISAGQVVTVTYKGAPGSSVDILSRTQPATAFSKIGSVVLNSSGVGTSTHKPQKNTRVTARSSSGEVSSSQPLIQVKSVASFRADRVGVRTYTFTGRVYPALSNRLVNVYRNGVLVAQARCDSAGIYKVTRTLGGGTFTFQSRTPNDTYNLGAISPSVRVTVR